MPLQRKPATPAIPLSSGALAHAPRYNGELIPGFGNVTARDMVVPRLKVLQGLSPEVQDDPRSFFPGELYHSVLGECIGKELLVVPLQVQRTIELWAPRDSNEGLLARSTDGVHWDKPNTKFEVRIDGKRVIWDTKNTVQESGLAEFGSSKPGNPKSAPVASLTFRLALYLVERPELSPCLMINSKTATQPVMDLISRINIRHLGGTPFYAQQYRLAVVKRTSGPNEYYGPSFRNEGNLIDKALIARLDAMSQAMATLNVRTTDETPADEPLRPNRAEHEAF